MPDPAVGAGGAAAGTDGDGEHRSRSSGPSDEGRGVARKLIQRFRGKAEDALAVLADENRELRDTRRDLRKELDGFKAADVLVLKGDDLKAYNDVKAIVGTRKPADLKVELDELGTLRTKVATSDRQKSASDAAQHLGWNAEAFAAMVVDKGLEVSLVDAKDKDDKAIKVPHVKPANDAKATAVSAADWVKSNASYLMPSLTAKPASSANGSTTQQRTGTQFVEQGGAGGGNGAGNGSTNGGGAGTERKPIPGTRPYMTPAQLAASQKKA